MYKFGKSEKMISMRIELWKIIKTYKLTHSYTRTSRLLGIHRHTVKRWVIESRSIHQPNYYKVTGLNRLSTRPKRHSKALTFEDIKLLIKLADKHRCDQVKLAMYFEIQTGRKVNPNYIKKYAERYIQKKPNFRRPRFQDSNHMRPSNTTLPGYLQLDVKYVTPELSGLTFTTYEYGFIDIHTRFKFGIILPTCDTEATIIALRYVLKVSKFNIKFIQTDNG